MKKNDKIVKINDKNKVNSKKQINIKSNKEFKEFNGAKGLEPTRYGDWEKNGRCTDF